LPTNRIEKIYSKFALKIQETIDNEPEKKILGRIFAELEKELKAEAPSAQLFKERFGEVCYKNSENSRRLIKYILSEIDSRLRATDENRIDFNTVNIEHVLPQNPHKDWRLTKNEVKGYVNKIGNLTLLSKRINSKVQNVPIEKKLPELEKSELPITRELVLRIKGSNSEWGEEQIIRRQEEFAETALTDIWRL
jgi:hypothetical protein